MYIFYNIVKISTFNCNIPSCVLYFVNVISFFELLLNLGLLFNLNCSNVHNNDGTSLKKYIFYQKLIVIYYKLRYISFRRNLVCFAEKAKRT